MWTCTGFNEKQDIVELHGHGSTTNVKDMDILTLYMRTGYGHINPVYMYMIWTY